MKNPRRAAFQTAEPTNIQGAALSKPPNQEQTGGLETAAP
jgi:hypothetical protein